MQTVAVEGGGGRVDAVDEGVDERAEAVDVGGGHGRGHGGDGLGRRVERERGRRREHGRHERKELAHGGAGGVERDDAEAVCVERAVHEARGVQERDGARTVGERACPEPWRQSTAAAAAAAAAAAVRATAAVPWAGDEVCEHAV